MTRRPACIGFILAAIWIAAAYAVPIVQSSGPAVDLSGYAPLSNVPTPCGTVPLADTLNGSVGAGNCFQRPGDTRPTVVQAAVVTTDAAGAWTVTWAKAFAGASPYINPQAINAAGIQPYICNVASSTSTTASGKCWQTVTMTLPSLASSLLGLVLNPTGAAPSIQVRVAARDVTQ